MGKFKATNDKLIEDLLKDENIRVMKTGQVFSRRSEQGHILPKGEWRLANTTHTGGYQKVSYFGAKIFVHRIVYRAFHGPLKRDMVVNHIDGNTANNKPSNLELITISENNIHRFRVLKRDPVKGNAKIDDKTAEKIRRDHDRGLSYRECAEKYEISKTSIAYIIQGKTWAAA